MRSESPGKGNEHRVIEVGERDPEVSLVLFTPLTITQFPIQSQLTALKAGKCSPGLCPGRNKKLSGTVGCLYHTSVLIHILQILARST